MEENEKITTALQFLNKIGRNIVFINEQYYDYTGGTFEPTSMHVSISVLNRARNITNLIKVTNIILTPDISQQRDQLLSQIEIIPTVKIHFSNQYKFINYLAS